MEMYVLLQGLIPTWSAPSPPFARSVSDYSQNNRTQTNVNASTQMTADRISTDASMNPHTDHRQLHNSIVPTWRRHQWDRRWLSVVPNHISDNVPNDNVSERAVIIRIHRVCRPLSNPREFHNCHYAMGPMFRQAVDKNLAGGTPMLT